MGFRLSALSHFGSNSYAVLTRELIQNCIDAGATTVTFHDVSVRRDEVPGLTSYRKHMKAAKRYAKKEGRLELSRSAVTNMEHCADGAQVRTLWVEDNGRGMGRSDLPALLGDGASQKAGADSAGAFGNGHFAAFAASEMRCVLYATRERGGEALGVGQTILADHEINGVEYGHIGYLCRGFKAKLKGAWDFFGDDDMPPALADRLRDVGPQGSVVGILGRKDHDGGRSKESLAEVILRTAACNFAPAIQSGKLQVRVHTDSKPCEVLDSNTLRNRLDVVKGRKTSRDKLPTGLDAYMMRKAMMELPVPVDCLDGQVVLHILPISKEDAELGARSTGIHFHRNGMWVGKSIYPRTKLTKEGEALSKFTCVVLLDHRKAGEMCDLMKKAEGPKHIDPQATTIESPADRKAYRAGIEQILEGLLAAAPSRPALDDCHDPRFLTVESWSGETGAGKQPYDEAVPVEVGIEDETPDELGPEPDDKPPRPTHVQPDAAKPPSPDEPKPPIYAKAKVLANRQTVRRDQGGVLVRAALSDKPVGDEAAVRVFIDTGRDSTCLNPPRPKFVKLGDGARMGDKPLRRIDGTGFAFRPDDAGARTLELVLPCAAPRGVRLRAMILELAQPQ